MTVIVQPGSGRISTGTYPSSYGYLVSHDTSAGESVTIATASGSNPRIDVIVAYVDKGVAGSTSPTYVNNTNNVLKFASVAGTPSGSPVAPTTSQINTAIGASNPYIILAQIAVATSATTITNPNISDKRTFAGPRLTSSALNLGFAQITSNFSTTSTTNTAVTGLTATVTIPAGRGVKVTVYCPQNTMNAIGDIWITIWDGSVGSGTQLQESHNVIPATNYTLAQTTMAVQIAPTAGTHTYSVGMRVNANQGTIAAGATVPAFVLVEAL